jgi:hypothetical protein
MLAGAITGSYLLNLSYYLANGARWEHALGMAALLPGFIALLGAMMPGLAGNAHKHKFYAQPLPENAQPLHLIDPLPMMQEALAAMERSIDNRMAELDNRLEYQNAQNVHNLDALVHSLASIPENVQKQLQEMHFSAGERHSEFLKNAPDLQKVAGTLAELGRKLQRREIKIAEYDRAVSEVLGNFG